MMRTAAMLRRQELGPFIPVVCLLFLIATCLWAINAVSPLAPFIYSLF